LSTAGWLGSLLLLFKQYAKGLLHWKCS